MTSASDSVTAQAERPQRPEAGFSLVAVVAGMTIMLILMGAAMPSWKYVAQNEREQELFFRGDQIATAIERYQKKNGGTAPPSLEVLVKGKYLRKAYTDPMVEDGEWKFLRAGEVALVRPGGLGAPMAPAPRPSPTPRPRAGTSASPQLAAPFVGVVSTSDKESLRVMNGQDRYDQWMFVAGRPRVLGRSGMEPQGGNAGVPTPPTGQAPGQAKIPVQSQ